MLKNTHIETLPAYWASALINSDYSGYTNDEIVLINESISGLPAPVAVSDHYIGRYNGLLCDVAEYTFLLKG